MTATLPLGREQLLGLIPHAGSMCLLDTVLEFSDAAIVCETASHRDPGNPLRRDQALSAIHLVEYAAQAMAAHGALQSQGSAQPGMLASLRQIALHVEHAHDVPGRLTVRAHRLLAQPQGSLYEFSVSGDGRLLCEGRVAIALG